MEVKDLLLDLELYGYAVIDSSWISPKLLTNLIKLHSELIHNINENEEYPGGGLFKWNAQLKPYSKNSQKYLNEFINSNFVNSVIKSNLYNKYKLHSVFATLDTPQSNHIAQDPHFDREPKLKFMLYLNDMKAENGAFTLSPGSHNWVKKEFPLPRPPFVSEKFLNQTRVIPSTILEKLKPIEGKAGTIIIFNTDTIHLQGSLSFGESRIIRFHFLPPYKLNKYSSFRERIASYLKKNI